MAVTVTLCISSVCYASNKPNSYEVRIGGKVAAYISESDKSIEFVKNIGEEFEKRFGSSKLKDSITFSKAQVSGDYLTDNSGIKTAIAQNCPIEVDALSMVNEGKEIAVIGNENEGKLILDRIKEFYASKSGIKVSEAKLKSNITYAKKKSLVSNVDDVDKVVERIKEVNAKSQKPIILFEIKGLVESKENIAPPTVVKMSDNLLVGQSKVTSSGQEGQKSVTKEIILENNKIVSSKDISENIIIQAKERVVLQGRKSSANTKAAFLGSPSRGTISSPFGMRWGKMHEGMDIAAAIGTPIYAAIDGTVSFAGWETGYGNFIKIQHPNGLETSYGHCSKIDVSVGQKVKKGDKIGEVGNTGKSTGPHLHFEVRVNGKPTNPVAYLSN